MWEGKPSAVVIFVCGSGEGFRYVHATAERVVFQNVFGYRMDSRITRCFREADNLKPFLNMQIRWI